MGQQRQQVGGADVSRCVQVPWAGAGRDLEGADVHDRDGVAVAVGRAAAAVEIQRDRLVGVPVGVQVRAVGRQRRIGAGCCRC